jgi:hypothetical protein
VHLRLRSLLKRSTLLFSSLLFFDPSPLGSSDHTRFYLVYCDGRNKIIPQNTPLRVSGQRGWAFRLKSLSCFSATAFLSRVSYLSARYPNWSGWVGLASPRNEEQRDLIMDWEGKGWDGFFPHVLHLVCSMVFSYGNCICAVVPVSLCCTIPWMIPSPL